MCHRWLLYFYEKRTGGEQSMGSLTGGTIKWPQIDEMT